MPVGGIILGGGHSVRMGTAKALLPFGEELLLTRMVRILASVVQPVVVVAAEGQALPDLPAHVRVVTDLRPDRGPLEGLHAGLTTLVGEVEAAYVTSCDAPLLAPGFVKQMIQELGAHAVAVPYDEATARRGYYPLAGVYRVSLLPQIAAQLASNRLRLTELLEQVDTHCVPLERLQAVDPALHSLVNCNTPEEYQEALQIAGL